MMHQDRERIFQAQMDGFLCKPIQMRDLQDIVLRYGRLGRSAAGDELHQFLTTISGRAGAPSGNFGAKL
jgi:CheY-like chemotaxis protein